MVSSCYDIFAECVRAIRGGELIQAVSATDKEYHFQNWFQTRLDNLGLDYDEPGRNTYPDFRLVSMPEGYEIKGLATPGRDKNYDSNSRLPSGLHKGRSIFYVFGRYPKDLSAFATNADGNKEYPVIDLIICHGSFLNTDNDYIHKNKSIKYFGSYGDIMIRDRKMYVAPTPYALTTGTTGVYTLVVPDDFAADPRFEQVGNLVRVEAEKLVVGYSFNLRTNRLKSKTVPNPLVGKKYHFVAYRLKGQGGKPVCINQPVSSGKEHEG